MGKSEDSMQKFMQAMADANYAEARRQARRTSHPSSSGVPSAAPVAEKPAKRTEVKVSPITTSTPSDRPINAEYLRLLREAFGEDVPTVAARAGLPADDVTTYEMGRGAATIEAIAALASALSTSEELLTRSRSVVKLVGMSPKLDSLDSAKRATVIAQARLWLDRYLDIESLVDADEIPDIDLPEEWPLAVRTPAEAAAAADKLRAAFGWGDALIHTFSHMLTDIGLRVGLINLPNEIDAASFFTDDEYARPIIVIEHNLRGSFQRFAMARELANLVLDMQDPKLAAHFAASFLATPRGLIRDVGKRRTALDKTELAFLKQKYSVPVHILVPALASLKIIDKPLMDEWMNLGRSRGWDDLEDELGGRMPPERPQRMLRLAQRFVVEGGLDEEVKNVLVAMPWLDRS